MEIRTVKTFLRVAELQSFSNAAEQLGYSQAAVTVQVRQLEETLGVQLFERIGKRIKLTDYGIRFIPYATNLLKAAQDAENFIDGDEQPIGRLRIGVMESLFTSVMPPILLEFRKLCPGVETSIHTGLITKLFDMIRQNDIDILYFLEEKTYFPEWVKVVEKPEPIIFVSSSAHPLAAKKKVPLEKILREPFILTEKEGSYRYALDQMLAARGMEIHPFLEAGNTDVIVRMLLNQENISFLPQYVVQEYINTGELSIIHVDMPPIQMWTQLIYHKNKWITPQLKIFINLMLEYIRPNF